MMVVYKIISTCLGIGYIKKGGGTVAAIFTCIVWFLCSIAFHSSGNNIFIEILIILFLSILGIYTGNKLEKLWGKDSYRIVLDEVVGMLITLIGAPANWKCIFLGLLFFRVFDIAKPLYIRKLEKIPGGWGVMLDDIVAGIYALIVLQIVLTLFAI